LLGELRALPRPSSWISGGLLLRGGWRQRGREMQRKGREEKGKGVKRKGGEGSNALLFHNLGISD